MQNIDWPGDINIVAYPSWLPDPCSSLYKRRTDILQPSKIIVPYLHQSTYEPKVGRCAWLTSKQVQPS